MKHLGLSPIIKVPFDSPMPRDYVEVLRDKKAECYPIPKDGTNGIIYAILMDTDKYIYSKKLGD